MSDRLPTKEDLNEMCDTVFHIRVLNVKDDYYESNDEYIIEFEFLDGPLSKTYNNYEIKERYKK